MKTKGLNFIEAVQAAKDNMENEERRRVRRPHWNGALLYGKFGGLIYLNFDEHCRQPFTPSYDDIMATDFEIVIVPPKSITFMEALKHIKAGKEIRRQTWKDGKYVRATVPDKRGIGLFVDMGIAKSSPLTIEDFEADDWVVE